MKIKNESKVNASDIVAGAVLVYVDGRRFNVVVDYNGVIRLGGKDGNPLKLYSDVYEDAEQLVSIANAEGWTVTCEKHWRN